MFDTLKQKFRAALLGPKDYFERAKRRVFRMMLFPFFLVFGLPSLITGVLTQVQLFEVTTQDKILRFAGNASYDTLILAISVVIMFLFAVGTNFLYSVHLTKSLEELDDVEKASRRRATYESLVLLLNSANIPNGSADRLRLGQFILDNYPEYAQQDAALVLRVIGASPAVRS